MLPRERLDMDCKAQWQRAASRSWVQGTATCRNGRGWRTREAEMKGRVSVFKEFVS